MMPALASEVVFQSLPLRAALEEATSGAALSFSPSRYVIHRRTPRQPR